MEAIYEAAPAAVANLEEGFHARDFSRDQSVVTVQTEPKLALKEMRGRLVCERLYDSLEEVPDASTLWRRLQSMGLKVKRPN